MKTQALLFGGEEVVEADRIEQLPPLAPMTDMACQPTFCEACGAPYRRSGAYLYCTKDREHWRWCETVGCEDHPLNAQWNAYLDKVGRDRWEKAIQRDIASRRF